MRFRRSGLAVRLTGLAAGVALAGACTVPVNDEPVELSASVVPETTTSTSTTSPQAVTRREAVYFLQTTDGSTTLQSVPRSIDVGSGVQGVLSNLFTQRPTDEEAPGLTSAIPESATLQSASRDPQNEDRLVVEVGGLFGSTQGAELRNALAQIVWTATEGNPELRVVFRQDGVAREALVDNLESTAEPVSRADYSRTN